MATLWKGLKSIYKKDTGYPSGFDFSVFSKEMPLKMVFVGGHQSGKTSIVRILNKQKFSTEYDPTIGIDQHKIRLEYSENKQSLWIWDVSHAEIGGVHEPLIFHQAHGIILVADLTNFTNIQAIDQWLHSISVFLKRTLESQQVAILDKDEESKSEHKSEDIAMDKQRHKHKKNILIPRLYLLITKHDLSDEPILTDTQLHKFCKSNSIRAFARISAKVDRRSEMMDIFEKFSEDIVSHLPSKTTYHILQEENDRFRYNYAIQRLQRNKINKNYYDEMENKYDGTDPKSVFDLRLHCIKTFKWMSSPQAIDEHHTDNDSNSDDEYKNKNKNKNKNKIDRRLIAQNKLCLTEEDAKRVLIAMKEAIKLQKNKTMRDAREYQKNLLKLKAMNQSRMEKASKYRNDTEYENKSTIIGDNKNIKQKETLLDRDVITSLKLEMINGLEQEIDNLTQIWEDELNTIAELIRFQIPLQRTNANLHRLSQQIIAKEMLFKRRIRLVSELMTQNRVNVSQMMMMQQQEKEKDKDKDKDVEDINNAEQHDIEVHNDHNNSTNPFFSSMSSEKQSIEALP